MLERILIGILALGVPNSPETNSTTMNLQDPRNINFLPYTNLSKFHVGMLSISLIVGLAYSGFAIYCCWFEENIFLSHIRNLVIALFFRTFFTLLFHAIIMLDDLWNVGGSNTLLSFECICSNLVVAFWLVMTIYLYSRVQKIFNNESNFVIYQYGVPGIALFFSFVWIFAMEGEYGRLVWWFTDFFVPISQWITNSLRLLYLFIQLFLVLEMARMLMKKASLDNDSISLLRKAGIMMGLLVFLFWLEFGLSVGRPSPTSIESYLYFFYLIDGLQCALVCPIFFFLEKWVGILQNNCLEILTTKESSKENSRSNYGEVVINGNRSIVTLDYVFMTRESRHLTNTKTEETKDIVYSSVVQPERLNKTLDLYKRLRAIPQTESFEKKEEFYDCISNGSHVSHEECAKKHKHQEACSPKTRQKNECESPSKVQKNAFYSSKYLIVDDKEKEFPKYLETRPSVSSMESEFVKTDTTKKDSASLVSPSANEYVEKWLDTCREEHFTLKNNNKFLKTEKTHKNSINFKENF